MIEAVGVFSPGGLSCLEFQGHELVRVCVFQKVGFSSGSATARSNRARERQTAS